MVGHGEDRYLRGYKAHHQARLNRSAEALRHPKSMERLG